jgi:hypothetical protein
MAPRMKEENIKEVSNFFKNIKLMDQVRVCDSRRARGYRASQKYLYEAILIG